MRSECAGFEFVDVVGSVNAKNVFVGREGGRDELGRGGEFLCDERVANEAVLLRRENVGTEVEVVVRMINERD